MDPDLTEILATLREQAQQENDSSGTASLPSPEALRDQAYVLSSNGERREAADTLRRAVNLAESIGVEPTRMIPLLEAMAEVLWQVGEKQEARMCANRALQLWFAARPSGAFDVAVKGMTPA